MDYVDISYLIGKTIISISQSSTHVLFLLKDGSNLKMIHDQDCCETVVIEEIIGEFSHLIHSPITMAEEVTSFEKIKLNDGRLLPNNPNSSRGHFIN